MGNADDLRLIRAKEIVARFAVAAAGLGIDPSALRTELIRLVESLDRYGCIWVDADFRRIGLRTLEAKPPPLPRPGRAHVELETNPDGKPLTTLWMVGAGPLDDDLDMIAADGVPRALVDDLGAKLRALGATRAIAVGHRQGTWLVTVELGADSVQPVSVLAEAIGVAPYQVAMLGQVHDELAVNGCTATLAITRAGIRPELSIAYRSVAWPTAIAVTNRLHRGDASRGYGVFAGAFQTEHASYLEITFRADAVARVRAAFEYDESEVS